jgi:DNA-binding transcriptional MocR family regulator
MSRGRKIRIARIVKRKNLLVIEDDVYGKLLGGGELSLASHVPDHAILVASLSKTLSVGLRLAFLRVPARHRIVVLESLRASSFFPSPLLCEIATKWIEDGTATSLLNEQRQATARRLAIAKEILGSELILGSPAGNHIWLRLPAAWSNESLERAASESGVLVYSGDAFCFGGRVIPNLIRIALGAARNESELRVGLGKLSRLLNKSTEPAAPRY